jgi:hypothetical protein
MHDFPRARMSGGESLPDLSMHKQAAIMMGIDNVDI